MYDIIIVGAGPAGANLARLLGSSYKVLIIDKRDLDNPYVNSITKSCGGLLAPDAQEMLAKLGLGVPKDVLVTPQLFAVRTIDITNKLERLYQRFYINIDREKFDRWLVSMIPTGVDKKFNCLLKDLEFDDYGCNVSFYENGKYHKEKAKLIVGADGANSLTRKKFDNGLCFPQKYISIQEWFEDEGSQPYYTAIFDDEITDYYSWIIPKDGKLLVGSALNLNNNPNEKFNHLKNKLISKGFKLNNSLKREGAFINRPISPSQFNVGNKKIALIGEASGAISPSSAEGISYALNTSYLLYESLKYGLNDFHKVFKTKSFSIETNLLLKNLKIPAMYNKNLRRLVMKSGIKSIQSKQNWDVISVKI